MSNEQRCELCKYFIPKIRINDGAWFTSCEFVQSRDSDFDLWELLEMEEGSQGECGKNYFCDAFEPAQAKGGKQ